MPQNFLDDGAPFSVTKFRALASAHESEGVLSGCGLSPGTNDWDVDVASGTVDVQQSRVTVSGQTVTHTSSETEDRIDLITVNSSGTASVTQGSPATSSGQPNAPDIPAGEVLLGLVVVRGNSAEILAGDIYADYRTPLTNVGVALANFDDTDQFADYPIHNGDVEALQAWGAGDSFGGYPIDTDQDTDHAGSDHHDGGTMEIDAGDLDGSSGNADDVLVSDGSAANWESISHPQIETAEATTISGSGNSVTWTNAFPSAPHAAIGPIGSSATAETATFESVSTTGATISAFNTTDGTDETLNAHVIAVETGSHNA